VSAGAAAEARRQQALLQALAQASLPLPAGVSVLGRLADASAGLRTYRANAQACAERALAAAYPVLAQMLGEEAMRALARDLWRAQPPLHGDLACFGGGLAGWVAGVPAWAGMPWLADVARLEWAVHTAQGAADAPAAPPDLQPLGDAAPDRLRVEFVPGSARIVSEWPVLTLWRAHQRPVDTAPDLHAARQALAERRAEAVWVWRRGLQVELAALGMAELAFNDHLTAGLALGQALAEVLAGHPDFSFEHWLTRALREGWLARFLPLT
jgi:hypothetical protein